MRVLTILLLTFSMAGYAQTYHDFFGKSRIQYKEFTWRKYSSENFNVHFYDGGAKIARETIDFLEEGFPEMTDVIGYLPYYRINIFIYNSHQDYLQSNVGLKEQIVDNSGQINVIKPQLEVAYKGTWSSFSQEIRLRLAEVVIDEMLFGGSISEIFQSAYLLELPDWFTQGAALYVTKGWSLEIDDYSRKLFEEDPTINLNRYTGEEAAWIGYSFWNYLTSEYGKGVISNILNLTRIIRSEEKSISRTLVRPYEMILLDWKDHYKRLNEQLLSSYNFSFNENELFTTKKSKSLGEIELSPNGQLLAYSEHKNGKAWVKVLDLNSGNDKILHRSGFFLVNQEKDETIPLMAWSDDKTLAIVDNKKGVTTIFVYDVENENFIPIPLPTIDQVVDFEVAEGRSLALLSASSGNQSDIFLTSLRRPALKRLTNDIYDDIDPSFIPGTNRFVFSSNRITNTLRRVPAKPYKEIDNPYNLFLYDLDTTRTALARLTNTISNEIHSEVASPNILYFLSDQKGIYNLYKFSFGEKITSQVTNNPISLENFAIDSEKLYFTTLTPESQTLYMRNDFNPDKQTFTPQTARQNIMLARFLAERKLKEKEASIMKRATIQMKQDSIKKASKKPSDPNFIDTDNYVFDSDVIKSANQESSFLSKYKNSQTDNQIFGPTLFKPSFVTDNIVTNSVFDPLRRAGMSLETQMNDQLENHHLFGGMTVFLDLTSSDFYAGYQYLKNRVDYQITFHRNTLLRRDQRQAIYHKYLLNEVEGGILFPISSTARFSLHPFLSTTRFIDYDAELLSSNINGIPQEHIDFISQVNLFPGIRGHYVFDNTTILGPNIYDGTKARVSVEWYQGVQLESFGNIEAELRRYFKIHRNFILATRMFYGNFFGPDPKNYIAGGVMNWISLSPDQLIANPEFNNPLSIERYQSNEDIVFARFSTPLRGYRFNQVSGKQSATFNAELRLPVINYLYSGTVSNSFFSNLQLVGFVDAGLAWSEGNPFNENNNINRITFERPQTGTTIELQNYQNPWLTSYGYGLRSVLLTFFVKLDVAFPLNPEFRGSNMIHLWIGYDF